MADDLRTVDDLEEVTAAQKEKYEHEVRQAESLIADATNDFCDWWRTRDVVRRGPANRPAPAAHARTSVR